MARLTQAQLKTLAALARYDHPVPANPSTGVAAHSIRALVRRGLAHVGDRGCIITPRGFLFYTERDRHVEISLSDDVRTLLAVPAFDHVAAVLDLRPGEDVILDGYDAARLVDALYVLLCCDLTTRERRSVLRTLRQLQDQRTAWSIGGSGESLDFTHGASCLECVRQLRPARTYSKLWGTWGGSSATEYRGVRHEATITPLAPHTY